MATNINSYVKQLLIAVLFLFSAGSAVAQISVASNFEVNAPLPTEVRDTMQSVGDTLRYNNANVVVPGLVTFVINENWYWYRDNFGWKEWPQGGGVGTDDQTAAEVPATDANDYFTTDNLEAITQELGASVIQSVSNYSGENLFQEDGTTTSNELLDYINGVRIPVAQNWKLTDTVALPDGFNYIPESITFFRRENGEYGTNVDDIEVWRDSFLRATEGTYYVDYVGGSNFNDGLTPETAFADYSFAKSRTGARTFYLAPGIYDLGGGVGGQGDTTQIIGQGVVDLVSLREFAFSPTTLTGVYKAIIPDTIFTPLNPKQRGELGQMQKYRRFQDSTLVANTPYSYAIIADSLYINAEQGQPVTRQNIVIASNSVGTGTAAFHWYGENVNFYGVTAFGSHEKVYLRNTGHFYNVVNGNDLVSFAGLSDYEAILYDCRIGWGVNDAIDWKNQKGCELNCTVRYAGIYTDGAHNQLSTGHTGSRVITVNPDYRYASNQGVLDVNLNTQRLILGGYIGDVFNKEGTETAAIAVGNASGNSSEMWVEGTKLGGTFDYHFRPNFSTIYLRNVKVDATTPLLQQNSGTIQKY